MSSPEAPSSLMPSKQALLNCPSDAVRTALLKIPGNHEDLRPPVEFGSTDFGLVSVAMIPETADELGSISIPRPGGKAFTLDLD